MLSNRSMPRSSVIPVLSYPDVGEAIEWLCATFGFTVRWRVGDHRAQLNVGEGAMAVRQQRSGERNRSSNQAGHHDSVMVRVEDVDAHYELAKRMGGRIVQPPTDHPYGERQYTVQDLAGHAWTFSQSIADIAPEEWGAKSFHL